MSCRGATGRATTAFYDKWDAMIVSKAYYFGSLISGGDSDQSSLAIVSACEYCLSIALKSLTTSVSHEALHCFIRSSYPGHPHVDISACEPLSSFLRLRISLNGKNGILFSGNIQCEEPLKLFMSKGSGETSLLEVLKAGPVAIGQARLPLRSILEFKYGRKNFVRMKYSAYRGRIV